MNLPSNPANSAENAAQPETLSALRRFARSRPPVERCELCGAELGEPHQHLLQRHARQIACSCDACAILFCGQENGQYLRVPRRVRRLRDFAFSDLEWEELTLPINLAFFIRNAENKMAALYPSPAGVIESVLALDTWDDRVAGNSALQKMEPEVEALLVNRLPGQAAYFIVPIDECYRLVGLIRTKWHGLSGGAEVWPAISSFFEELQEKACGTAEVQLA
jgi:hypothetical protein